MLLFMVMRIPSQVPRSDGKRPGTFAVTRLSPEAAKELREQFEAHDTYEKKQELLRTWIRAAVQSRWRPRREVDQKELDRFYNEQLSNEQREVLNQYSGDRFKHELRSWYFRSRFGSEGRRGRGPRGFGPDRRGSREDRRGPRRRPDEGRRSDGRNHPDEKGLRRRDRPPGPTTRSPSRPNLRPIEKMPSKTKW